MSLDVYLNRKRYLSYDEGRTYTEDNEEVYWANITHNLSEMADKAEIYKALWRPEEIEAKYAKDIIEIVEKGLADLRLQLNALCYDNEIREKLQGVLEIYFKLEELGYNIDFEYDEQTCNEIIQAINEA